MSGWLLALWWAGPVGQAGELNFAPDRPGFGDNPQLVGGGHVMIEGGVDASVGNIVTPSLADLVFRIGAMDALEVQVLVPGFRVDYPVAGIGLGVKGGGRLSEHWSLSGVYRGTVVHPVNAGGFYLGSDLSGNLGWADDRYGAWLHLGTRVFGFGGSRLGGGASVFLDPVGLYANAAIEGYPNIRGIASVRPMVGGGAWLAATDRFQLDLGVDLYVRDGVSPVARVGASGAF